MRYAVATVEPYSFRTLRKFAWFPRRIGGTWVWLEVYLVVEKFWDTDGDGDCEWAVVDVTLSD